MAAAAAPYVLLTSRKIHSRKYYDNNIIMLYMCCLFFVFENIANRRVQVPNIFANYRVLIAIIIIIISVRRRPESEYNNSRLGELTIFFN